MTQIDTKNFNFNYDSLPDYIFTAPQPIEFDIETLNKKLELNFQNSEQLRKENIKLKTQINELKEEIAHLKMVNKILEGIIDE